MHINRIIMDLRKSLLGALVSQLWVCSCHCTDLQHPQKFSLIYWPRASAETGSSSQQKNPKNPDLSQQLGPAAGGENVAVALTALHPQSILAKKNQLGFTPLLNRAGDTTPLFCGTTLRVTLSFPTTLVIKPSSSHLLAFDCNLSTPIYSNTLVCREKCYWHWSRTSNLEVWLLFYSSAGFFLLIWLCQRSTLPSNKPYPFNWAD